MTVPPTPASLVTIPASEGLEKIAEVIARDGGVIVKDFLSPDLLKEVMDGLEPHFKTRTTWKSKATHGELGNDFFPEGSIRLYALMSKIPEQLTKVLRLPLWNGIMSRFLDDEYYSYTGENFLSQKSGHMIGSTAALRLVPGAQRQPLHRDQLAYLTRYDPERPLTTPMLGCLIAGTKCTKKNGATLVIPGSHLWGPDRSPKLEECTYAEMEPGSALFTLGSTYHGAGENKCDQSDPDALRTLIAVFGQRDYLRPDQDEVLTTPLEIAQSLPDDILKLMGYYKAVGGVGYVEDHQHPIELMRAETGVFGKLGSGVNGKTA
ncbi:phytanoyl-CoA dioxygenase [Kwoniella heveanensis CBS 569]|nr:phytanoyl-CoA dioxygenase [Kwoniella heveanensis CBS 569]